MKQPKVSVVKLFHSISLMAKMSLVILGIFAMMAIISGTFTQYPADTVSGPPLSAPDRTHIMGTDELGTDIWAQICFGSRISLCVGIGTAFLAGFTGTIAGCVAGYRGGLTDRLIMRIVDILTVLPDLPVMIVLAAFFGPGLISIVLVLSMFSWVFTARIVRSQVLMLREAGYIKYATLSGAGPVYLFRHHFLPETLPLTGVSMIRLAGKAIVAEAGLSFLGLGDPVSKSWGMIIHHATHFRGIYFTDFWKWWLLCPWICLSLMVTSLAFISKDLEQFADRRLGGENNNA